MRSVLLASTLILVLPSVAFADGGGFLGGMMGGALGSMVGNMMSRPQAPEPEPPPPVYYAPRPVIVAPRPVIIQQRPRAIVIRIQERLRDLGYLPITAGIDGMMGPETRAAIIAWQRANGQPITGDLNETTLALLLAPPAAPPPPTTEVAPPTTVITPPTTVITTAPPVVTQVPATVQVAQQPATPAPVASATPAAPVTPISLPSTNQPILGEWNGTGMTITPPFHASGPWQVEWASTDGFSAAVGRVGKDGFAAIGEQSAGGQGSSYVPASSGGDFILRLNGSGRWMVRVISMAPVAATPAPTPASAPSPAPSTTTPAADPNSLTCGRFVHMPPTAQTRALQDQMSSLQQPIAVLALAVKTNDHLDGNAAVEKTDDLIVDGVVKRCAGSSQEKLADVVHAAIDGAMMAVIEHNTQQEQRASHPKL